MNTNEQERKDFDKACIANWVELIGEFNKLWDDKAPNKKYEELREKVKNTNILTYRQRDALICRCNNVLLGCYGHTKTDEQMNHSKPSGKQKAA